MRKIDPVYSKEQTVYSFPGFEPQEVNAEYLADLGVQTRPSEETIEALRRGSMVFKKRYEEQLLIPRLRFGEDEIDPVKVQKEIHNYTGRCPALTWEINPVQGCGVGCQ